MAYFGNIKLLLLFPYKSKHEDSYNHANYTNQTQNFKKNKSKKCQVFWYMAASVANERYSTWILMTS